MKKCPFCAEEIQDGAVFCRFCRRDLPIQNTPNDAEGTLPVQPKSKIGNLWWLIIILPLIGVVIFLIINIGLLSAKRNVVPNPQPTKVEMTGKVTEKPATILYSTDFTSNNNDWLEQADKETDFDVINGKYRMKSFAKDSFYWATLSQPFSDGILKVDLVVESSHISDKDGYSIFWRVEDENNHYELEIIGDGEVVLDKVEDGKIIELYRSGPGLVSYYQGDISIFISFSGAKSSVYINDQLITTIYDSTFPTGEIGLGIISGDSQDAIVAYDNLIVYSTNAANEVLPRSSVTPTPRKVDNSSCTLWSEISLDDVGKTKCVYGTVLNSYYQDTFQAFIFLFSSDPHAVYLIKHDYLYWDDVVGRCVSVTGKIQKVYQTPYIEIKDDFIYFCD